MKYYILFLALLSTTFNTFSSFLRTQKPAHHHVDAQWAIVGAGPAGIAAVGVLLDLGVPATTIIWIDPEFNVGRLGKYYEQVPSNIEAQRFLDFILCCKSFSLCCSPAITALKEYDLSCECPLYMIINPLRDITRHLCTEVHALRTVVERLDFIDDAWHIDASAHTCTANHVILATGSHPKMLNYAHEKSISLDLALDQRTLSPYVVHDDTVGVIGNAHSGILVLKNLTELGIARIINFSKHPIYFYWDEGHEASGIQGIAATWAYEHLVPEFPAHIISVSSNDEHLQTWLPICNKVIYAIGYERNELPAINGKKVVEYNDKTGVILPRLFGLGIAFPEEYITNTGEKEQAVGLKEFLDYAQRVIPEWMKRTTPVNSALYRFESLFLIHAVSI